MTSNGSVKSNKGQPSKHRGQSVKFYDSRKKPGPVPNTSHIPWIAWSKFPPPPSVESLEVQIISYKSSYVLGENL